MNPMNTKIIISALRSEGSEIASKFSMAAWINSCGTAGCIAGTCVLALAPWILDTEDCYDTAKRILGLTDDQADILFEPLRVDGRRALGVKLAADPWGNLLEPIQLRGPAGAAIAADALEKALKLWSKQ